MIVKMSKVEILGPKTDFPEVLSYLHQAGILHIESVEESIAGQFVKRMSAGDAEKMLLKRCEAALLKLNSLYNYIRPKQFDADGEDRLKTLYDKFSQMDSQIVLEHAEKDNRRLEPEIAGLVKEKAKLEQELSYLSQYESIFVKIEPLVRHLVYLQDLETVALLLEKRNIGVLQTLQDEMEAIVGDQFEIIAADVDENTIASLIIYKKKLSAKVQEALWGESVVKIKLPKEYENLDFQSAIKEMKQKIEAIPVEIAKLENALSEIGRANAHHVKAVIDVVTDHIHQLESIGQFGQTNYAFIIRGWMPTETFNSLKTDLSARFSKRVYIETIRLTFVQQQLAPVAFKNSRLVRPFQMLIKLLNTPVYGTVDPTPFVAFFFPLFFGLMLGDVGYGLLALLLGYWVKRKYSRIEGMKNLSTIIYLCATSAIMFGILFAEFFGDIPERLHWIRHFEFAGIQFPVERADPNLLTFLLVLTVMIGASQIMMGLVLGAVNAIRLRSPKHAFEKIGVLVFLIMVFVLAGTLTQQLPDYLTTPSMLLMITGLGMLVYGAGFLGLIEVVGVFTHILSYARLFAIGLASVILAVIVNQTVFAIESVFLAILAGVIFHAFNLVLGLFSPALHSMRLLFVEFFTKFYESGGSEYKPFQRIGGSALWK